MATARTGPKEPAGHEGVSIDSVRERVLAFEHEIKQYLDHLNANVEYYKFSVEKQGEGLTVEASVKATVRQRPSEPTTKA